MLRSLGLEVLTAPKQKDRYDRGMHAAIVVLLIGVLIVNLPATTIQTIVGTGMPGYSGDRGKAVDAQLNNPYGLVLGAEGDLYICDMGNHVIRRVSSSRVIRTFAGKGSKGYAGDKGPAWDALLNEPYEIRVDRQGGTVFVEMKNHLVRYVSPQGMISTLAGNGTAGFKGDERPALEAAFNQPHSIQFDARGDLYICDIGNHRVRKIDMEKKVVTTFAGTGEKKPTPDGARLPNVPLNGPRAIDFDAEGNMWLALREGNAIYRINMKHQTVHHIAGTGKTGFTGNGGPAKEATLSGPKGISVGPEGNVYFADTESHSIRMVDIRRGTVELIAGTGERGDGPDGDPLQCKLARPHGIFVSRTGDIYIGDSENHRVRIIRKQP